MAPPIHEEPMLEIITDDKVEHITMGEAQGRMLAQIAATYRLEEEGHEALDLILTRQREMYILRDQQAVRTTAMTALGLILLGIGVTVSARAAIRAEEKSDLILDAVQKIGVDLEAVGLQVIRNEQFARAGDERVKRLTDILSTATVPR